MPANPFVWYELMTDDLTAAERFYSSVVGWTSSQFEGSDPPYLLMGAGASKLAAGMMSLTDQMRAAGAKSGWIGYIGTRDVDAQTEKLRQAGGEVHREPSDIPRVGRFSVVADPQGAVFSLFQPTDPGEGPPPHSGEPGQIGWRELYATDWVKAFDFYAEQFGWTKDQTVDMGPMGIYQLFAIDGVAVGGMMTMPPQCPTPHWGFYFNVPEINAALDQVRQGGGKVLNGPTQVPGGSWIAQCLDPQGASFALSAPPAAAA